DCARSAGRSQRADGTWGLALGREAADYRADPTPLFRGRHGVRTGPRGLAADVDHVRPHVDEIEAMSEGGLGVEVATAIGERVRGDVEDPHHPRAIEDNLSRSMAPDRGLVPQSGAQRRIPISRSARARPA